MSNITSPVKVVETPLVTHKSEKQRNNYVSPNIIVADKLPSLDDIDSANMNKTMQPSSDTEKPHRTNFMKRQQEQKAVLNLPIISKSSNESVEFETDVPSFTSYQGNDTSSTVKKTQKICKFFRTHSCKHGISGKGCLFNHPKICNKFTQHGSRQPRGCNLGKACPYYHPKMCIDSLRKSECFNEHCRFNHVKGTARKPVVNQNKTSPPQKSSEIQQNNTPNQNFLQLIQVLKSDMDTQIKSLTAQIQQMMSIQQMQRQHVPTPTPLMPLNPVPMQHLPYYNPMQTFHPQNHHQSQTC